MVAATPRKRIRKSNGIKFQLGDEERIVMPRDPQFGTRKNPASHERQHGLRLAADSPSAHALISHESEAQKNADFAPTTAELHSPIHAAPTGAATGESSSFDLHLLTIIDVAQLLQVPVSWVYAHTRHRSKSRLPGYRLGKYWRFDRNEVLAWVQRQCKDFRAA